jgi:hypothetical protein
MWMIISLVLCAVFGIVTWNVTQSPIFVIAGITVAIAIASLIGPVPFWMVLVFLVISIGGKAILSNQS